MPGIQLSGLASGLDWQSLVDKLMAAERVPQDALRAQKAAGAAKATGFSDLTSQLTALQTAATALGKGTDIFGGRTATSSNASSTWASSSESGGATGTYQIAVTQLATSAQLNGAADAGNGLSATTDVSGLTLGTLPIGRTITAGDFTVNGARITVALTDSLQSVFDQISTKTGGAVAASYDPVTDKVKLNSTASPATEIVLGSGNDTSNFLSSLQLFNNGTGEVLPPKALGVVSVSAALANANLRNAITAVDGSGAGSFNINGVDIAYNANSDSVSSVLTRINASSAGVTASYDRINDRFQLTNKETGDVGVSVSESAGGFLGALGLTTGASLSHGANAQFTVNGGATLTSTSNVLDSSVHGIEGLSVKISTKTTETITVASNTTDGRAKIDNFITKFNAVQSFIDLQTKITKGSDGKSKGSLFSGNQEVSRIASQLRSQAFSAVSGLTGSISRLESLGIDFISGTSLLQVKDETKLTGALRDRADDVRTLFSSDSTGIAARMTTYLDQVTGSTGSVAAQTKTLSSQSTSIDDQIDAIERRLTQERKTLEQSFIQMEQAQSNIQTQLSQLTNSLR